MIILGANSLGDLGGEVTRGPPSGGRESRRSPPVVQGGSALAALVEETVALSRRLRAAERELHGREAPSGGRRALLRDLVRLGPQTVPQLARRRGVTRQHIQALANPLVEGGYVQLLDNRAHRRSRLLGLTVRGREYVAAMDRREREALSALEIPEGGDALRRAAEVLRSVREAVESGWI
jgi:DNA-binding MarR family transcriptional regulator